MRPEYYADLYRRYQTYVRNYGDNKIFKIACGPNVDDYHWMEVLMREACRFMDGISLHYYTVTGTWENKGSATDFDEEKWFITLKKSLFMEELIKRHSTIMDKYDPEKRVHLIVDEWGTWHDVEPGTNPGFLYQQNTMRDALVAGITLNIFNKYCDRVQMANIAQTINVLQAVILTRGAEMILTPTYHVFDLYKVHQDADLIDLHLESEDYQWGEEAIPAVSASASMDSNGDINITFCNLKANEEVELESVFNSSAFRIGSITGKVLAADQINAHNTFEEPEKVKPTAFNGARITEEGFSVKLPAASVVLLTLKRE